MHRTISAAALLLALSPCAAQTSAAYSLDPVVRAQCANITGVSVGDPNDHSTWRIDFTAAATSPCMASAQAVFWNGGTSNVPQSGNNDTGGKTVVSSAINPAQRTALMFSVGQSLETNFSATPLYTPTSNQVHNWNIFDRQTYAAADPLLGCEGPAALNLAFGNYLTRVADKLIALNKFDRVIIVCIGIGNTTVADWAAGGRYNPRLVSAIKAVTQSLGIPITWIHYGQGQRDGVLSTTQNAWQAGFASMVATIRAAGCNAPIFVTKETEQAFVISAPIRAAQAAVVDNVTIFAGSDFDPPSLPDTDKQADGTHFNAIGADAAATNEAAIVAAHAF